MDISIILCTSSRITKFKFWKIHFKKGGKSFHRLKISWKNYYKWNFFTRMAANRVCLVLWLWNIEKYLNTEQIFYIIWLLLDILIKPMFIFVGYPNGYSLSSILNLEKTSSCHKCWENGFSSDPNTLDSYFSPNYRSPRSNSIT